MKRDLDNIQVIIDYCERIIETINRLDEEDFLESYVLQSSCAFSILQIGEAVKRLSMGFAEQHPEVSWNKIAKFRDVLAHRYSGIDLPTVWTISSKLVPELLTQCLAIMKKENP